MRGHTFLGDAMHILGADLHFKGLAALDDGGVEGLIKIRPRHGNVVFETPGHGAPDLMDDAKRSITIALHIGDHPDGEEIVNLVQGALLAHDLAVQGIKPLDAALDRGGDAVRDQFFANGRFHFFEKLFIGGCFVGKLLLQGEETIRIEIAEGEIFELIAEQAHAEAVRDGSVKIERFAGDTLLLLRIDVFERTHVVETVRELDENDADVIHHGENHLTEVFRLAGFRSHEVEAADLRHALDQAGGVFAKALADLLERKFGIFDNVMQERGGKSRRVEANIGEDVSDLDRVRDIEIARLADLAAVTLGGDLIGAANQPGIFARAAPTELFEKLVEASVELTSGPLSIEDNRRIGTRGHL